MVSAPHVLCLLWGGVFLLPVLCVSHFGLVVDVGQDRMFVLISYVACTYSMFSEDERTLF